MNLETIYNRLGAKRNNSRWSWGAVHPNGTVILQVWSDLFTEGNRVEILAGDWHGKNVRDLGKEERQRHVELIRSGAQFELIVCTAVDPKAVPRSIQRINDKSVFTGSEIVDDGNRVFAIWTGRKSI